MCGKLLNYTVHSNVTYVPVKTVIYKFNTRFHNIKERPQNIPFSIQVLGIQSGSDDGGGGGGGGRSTGGLLPFLLPSFTFKMSSKLKEGPGGGFF